MTRTMIRETGIVEHIATVSTLRLLSENEGTSGVLFVGSGPDTVLVSQTFAFVLAPSEIVAEDDRAGRKRRVRQGDETKLQDWS
jgi:hypothetical protein